ncbi:LysR family transcriptional regulator [Nocardia sp. CA-107356]|uniref:LysR family transcriptional regulator n=1 Tax=Nocardia sp. CA-107356 TaxID=3239972 RepID=UPI003D942752
MIDVSHLRLLRTVIATGSIRASAFVLGYTPSAASQQLAALQRQTRLRLVERVGRGIEPTAVGRALARETEMLFEELNRLEGVVNALRVGRVGSLSIGYIGSVGAIWLPRLVDALRAEFPDLHLDLRMTEFTSGAQDIEIFVVTPNVKRSPEVHVHRLVDDPYVVVCRADDPLARLREVPMGELAERSWVDNDRPHSSSRDVLLAACMQAGFNPRFEVKIPDYGTALSFVAAGIGITVMPTLAAHSLPDNLISVPLVCPTPVRKIGVAIKKAVADHPAAVRAIWILAAISRGSGTAFAATPRLQISQGIPANNELAAEAAEADY